MPSTLLLSGVCELFCEIVLLLCLFCLLISCVRCLSHAYHIHMGGLTVVGHMVLPK